MKRLKNWISRTLATVSGALLMLHAGHTHAQQNEVSVGFISIIGPFSAAVAMGDFEKGTGYKIKWRQFESGAMVATALASGDIQIGVIGSSPVTAAVSRGVDIQLFWIQGDINDAEALVVRNGSGIDKPADLKGKKIGVTAPGSSTNVMVNFILAKAGLKPSDVSIIGVGAGNGAVAAMRTGQIDAISNLDPVITLLQRSGDLKIVSDTRVVAESEKVFGGPMPAGCFYAPQAFIDNNPNTVQAMTNAIVRANKWIQSAGAGDIINNVPESFLLGDRAVYIDAFLAAKGALSPDGMFPEKGADTAFRALASIDAELAKAKLDLRAVYTNDFVKKANARYPKG